MTNTDLRNCPKTGRSATLCDSPDHRNCPVLRPSENELAHPEPTGRRGPR